MCKFYDEEDKKEMISLIRSYQIEYEDCGQCNCEKCCFLEDCFYKARQAEDSEWAKLLDYGGYDTEEEFWEQLLN
jgi:hypothetical protein